MSTFIVETIERCRGVYSVEADTEAEAKEKMERGDADFSHYADAQIEEVVRVEEFS